MAVTKTPKVKSVIDMEQLEEFEITVKVPKPEAQIFTGKMKTKYESVPANATFLPSILRSISDYKNVFDPK